MSIVRNSFWRLQNTRPTTSRVMTDDSFNSQLRLFMIVFIYQLILVILSYWIIGTLFVRKMHSPRKINSLSYFCSAVVLSVSILLLNIVPMELFYSLKNEIFIEKEFYFGWLNESFQTTVWNVGFVGFHACILGLIPFTIFYEEDDDIGQHSSFSSRIWNSFFSTVLVDSLMLLSVFLIRSLINIPFSYSILELLQFLLIESIVCVFLSSLYLFPCGLILCFRWLALLPLPPNYNAKKLEQLLELSLELSHTEAELDRIGFHEKSSHRKRGLTVGAKKKSELESQINEISVELKRKYRPLIRNLIFSVLMIVVLLLLALFVLQIAIYTVQFFIPLPSVSFSPLIHYIFQLTFYGYFLFNIFIAIMNLRFMKSSNENISTKVTILLLLSIAVPIMYITISSNPIRPKGMFTVLQFDVVVHYSEIMNRRDIWIPLIYRLSLLGCIVFAILNRLQSLLKAALKSLFSSAF